MSGYADLEIGVHRRDVHTWSVELRYSQPGSDGDVRVVRDQAFPTAMPSVEMDPDAYGRALTDGLFASADIRRAFLEAIAAAESSQLALRLRLFIGPSAPELHALRWELLRTPDDDEPIAVSQRIVLSRYLSSSDWVGVGVRPKVELTALVVIADPAENRFRRDGKPFDPVDVTGELARARRGLSPFPITELAARGAATLGSIVTGLLEGHDILYLACHGFMADGEPQLLLEKADGTVDRVPGNVLVEEISRLQVPPRLVVLASCQSAGGDDSESADEGVLAALGPRLAEAGVPAVLAMQGNVSMRTIAAFMPAFFRELDRDGQIDRAVAAARNEARRATEGVDWWVPVLFMRLKSGRLWYSPGFVKGSERFEKWDSLTGHIREGKCTPVLGLGLSDSLLGSRRELARRWSARFEFPMAEYSREDLPRVAQYISATRDEITVRRELGAYLRNELVRRHPSAVPQDLGEGGLDQMLSLAWQGVRERVTSEPHEVLAELPFPIYITGHPANLLADALRAVGREPQVELCRWSDNPDVDWPPSIYVANGTDPRSVEAPYEPTPERPLVYHLFGNLDWRDTLVLTEDDYFDFLIGVTKNKDLIPTPVRRALTRSALLFLGFGMEEWDFRVLFRSIMAQPGSSARRGYAHVAAQIDPEEGRTLEPERARRYLEQYFSHAQVSIYWGTTEAFLAELHSEWKARSS
jgi:CHAT domain/SIR2-like domain